MKPTKREREREREMERKPSLLRMLVQKKEKKNHDDHD